ncbi:MAG: hypothetical protein D6725_01335, partial [Planctomycetota bacterium]
MSIHESRFGHPASARTAGRIVWACGAVFCAVLTAGAVRAAEGPRSGAQAAGAARSDGSAEKRAVRRRPNVLIAFADDWGCYASAYAKYRGGACKVVRTPHFDRVAREGVLFLNAFVAAPSCTPCRSAFLSGQYWWRTGLGAILQGAV